MNVNKKDEIHTMTSDDLLKYHQLDTSFYWHQKKSRNKEGNSLANSSEETLSLPDRWSLSPNLDLHEWQLECRKKWFQSNNKGIAKVVTGAGKTILALSIMEQLQNQINHNLKVAIIVPTIVLLNQWYDVLIKYTNIPHKLIRQMGGGEKYDFSDNGIIVIAVINSAVRNLKANVDALGIKDDLLLIIDECQKSGSKEMSKIFDVPRAYSLGLSATPERDNDFSSDDSEQMQDISFNDTLTAKELGPIIYELNYKKAIDDGILPPFEIKHLGLPLTPEESNKYQQISKKITDLRKTLQGASKVTSQMDGGRLTGWARNAAKKGGELSQIAAQYVQETVKRKELLYFANNRTAALIKLLDQIMSNNPSANIILFHERIEEIMRLYSLLLDKGYPIVAEHSGLSDKIRSRSIELFRQGIAQIIISGKALIEGFDAPAADVGIVIASTSSIRQSIQTIGRILRKPKDNPSDKFAKIYRLYISGTTDESLYKKIYFDEITGEDRNFYFLYNPSIEGEEGLIPKDGPPFKPPPRVQDIDWASLMPGDIYPGAYEGIEYTIDNMGNIKKSSPKSCYEGIITNTQDLSLKIRQISPQARSFKVLEFNNAVLIRRPTTKEKWETIFVDILNKPLELNSQLQDNTEHSQDDSCHNLREGDLYPFSKDMAVKYNIKQFRGSFVIFNPVTKAFALATQHAEDPLSGKDAEEIIKKIGIINKEEKIKITQICILEDKGLVLYTYNGATKILHKLHKGLEFKK